ncbi:MAG TPA: DUF2283 domain-containing protein [Candidatus Paceibacterota bacterium]
MKITYDKKVNAMYIYIQSGKKVAKTVPVNENIIVDLDRTGKLIGIEVLKASSQVSKKSMSNFELNSLVFA